MANRTQMLISPVWANSIDVEKEGDSLIVKGWDHLGIHPDVSSLDAKIAARHDLLEQFRRYALRQLSQKSGESEAGVYQFADAKDDEKLIAFVKEFGPIRGEVRYARRTGRYMTKELIVVQDLVRLRREREVFAASVELLGQVNRKTGRGSLGSIITALTSIAPIPELFVPANLPAGFPTIKTWASVPGMVRQGGWWQWSLFATESMVGNAPDKQHIILGCAHQQICELLNRFPPVLIPHDGRQPLELPRIEEEGILSALYFKLRLDYLAQRQIGTCQNCGGHFPVTKRGARACSQACRRALRNQKYWQSNKKRINQQRRKRHER